MACASVLCFVAVGGDLFTQVANRVQAAQEQMEQKRYQTGCSVVVGMASAKLHWRTELHFEEDMPCVELCIFPFGADFNIYTGTIMPISFVNVNLLEYIACDFMYVSSIEAYDNGTYNEEADYVVDPDRYSLILQRPKHTNIAMGCWKHLDPSFHYDWRFTRVCKTSFIRLLRFNEDEIVHYVEQMCEVFHFDCMPNIFTIFAPFTFKHPHNISVKLSRVDHSCVQRRDFARSMQRISSTETLR